MSQDKVIIEDWGLIPYDKAFARQDEYVQKIINNEKKETLVFCTHPPVVTLGRGTKPGDVFAWSGETIEVNRGGRATYHGPSQVIMYPLISIDNAHERFLEKTIPPRDLHQYLRLLEDSVIHMLKEVGIESQGRSVQKQVGEELAEEATGVWIGDYKIASVGIAVKKWITSHGVALNVFDDPAAFVGMNPCGFKTQQMTSLQKITGEKWDAQQIRQMWAQSFLDLLSK